MKATSTKKKSPAKAEVKENSFPVVAIGASAGGLEAMMELLKYLPSDTGMAFIYVQHLSPDHKSMLTEILSKKTSMKVQEIDDMDKIKPDNVFVIPYNKGIEVTDGHIKLIPRSETSAAISIDILFSSLAHAQKERVIGIILSGSASDGTVGMKTIKQEGGLTFAQDDTAKFTSMPHSAIAAGMVDFILSPKEIALELARLSKHPLIKTIGVKNGEEDLIDNRNPDLKTILNQLHKVTGVDFSAYKMNTVKRRIIRRMLLYKITILKEYAKLLSQKKEEIDILYQDLLINVTSFFRDTDTHKYLKENLFPKLLKRKKPGESLRIWVPACATGEEAYSFAMMLLEIQGSQTSNRPIQIFATDLSQTAIANARIGVYTKLELETVSPKRIQRFFSKANGGFRVNKAVRDMCVFAPHNILQDPPFSRLDFISCCNLFIYLDNAAQKKAVNTFHYALNDDGFLMLGKSENITQSANLFMGFNKKYKIFSRKINSGARTLPALLPRYTQQTFPETKNLVTIKNKAKQILSVNHNGLDNAIDAVLVSEFMPASVVINHQMEIVQFRGITDLFLAHPKGKATFNILKMARPEIAFELRNAISKVIKTKHRVRKSGIELKINSTVRIISFEIIQLKIAPMTIGADEPLLLIIFTEQEQTEIYPRQSKDGKNNSPAKDRRIKKLEEELVAAHADALAISQEQEAFTEELQSANEEVVSSNEELQTVNEELETSKEEIESANEELTTTNQELQTRNELLNESYDYSEAVIATMHNPMVVLDKSLRVKSASKIFYEKFKVNEEETEGVLLYDLGNRQWNIPRLRELLENILPKNSYFYDYEITHTFPLIGEKIMLLNASRIVQKTNHEELILLAFADVTEVRKLVLEQEAAEKKILHQKIETEQKLKEISEEKQKQLQNIFNHSPFSLTFMEGENFVYKYVNEKAAEILGAPATEIIGKSLFEILPEIKQQKFKEMLVEVIKTGKPLVGKEVPATYKLGSKLVHAYFDFVYEPFYDITGKTTGVISSAIDVTEKVLARKKIEDSEKKYRTLFTSIDQGFAVCELVRNKEGKGIDYYVLEVNPTYEKLSGVSMEMVLGKTILQVFPTVDKGHIDAYAAVVDNQQPIVFEQYFEVNQRWHELKVHPGVKDRFTVLFSDITERKQAEERQTFILKLSDAIKELIDPVDIQLTACRILGEHVKVNRVLYGEVIDEKQIIINNNYVNDVPPINATLDAEQFGRNVIDAFKRNEKVIISDITTDPGYTEEAKQNFLSLDVVANAGMGLIKEGRWVATFGMHYNAPRKWTATEIWLLEETAERTWAAVERAKAEQALRKSEEKYRTLITSIDQGFTLCELIRNKQGKAIDFYMLEVNPTYEEQTGVSKETVLGKAILQVFPSLNKWMETYASVVDNQCPVVFEHYFEDTDRWFAIKAYPFENERFTVLFSNITERKQAEEKIKESEKQYRNLSETLEQEVASRTSELTRQKDFIETIVNSTPDLVGAYDSERRIIAFNKACEDLLKVKREDVIGKIYTDAFPSAKGGQAEKDLTRALGGETIHNAVYHSPLSGRYYENFIKPLKDASGKIYGAVAIAHDITENLKATELIKQSEEKFNKLFAASPLGLVLAEIPSGRVIDANETYCETIGYSRQECIGKTSLDLNLLDKDERQKIIEKLLQKGFVKNVEIEITKKNGEQIPILNSIEKINIADKEYFLSAIVDISDRKNAERKVEQKNTELQILNRDLEAFTYVSSHDLQEPLRKIQTFASRILEKENQNLSDNGKNYFRLLQNSASRMQQLIHDLLAFSRISVPERKFENTNLNIIIEEVKKEFNEAIAEKHAVIEVKEICEVHIIPFQFRQLMHNLIGNALKFSNPKMPPHITIESHPIAYNKINVAHLPASTGSDGKDNVGQTNLPPQKEYCHIIVSDNGIGFEKEFAEKIFEVFQKLHGKDEYAGTGIGLAIVKKIVENHNGIITASSQLKKGTTFDIYIPAK